MNIPKITYPEVYPREKLATPALVLAAFLARSPEWSSEELAAVQREWNKHITRLHAQGWDAQIEKQQEPQP